MKKLTDRIILKKLIQDCANVPNQITLVSSNLHPSTIPDLQFHVHAIQNILIAEYVRHTQLKDELGLK